ncbi:MAG: circularly permuted type 2 ATP-grasp protein [Polyangiaceae bacterium]
MLNDGYALNHGYDELIAPGGAPRSAAAKVTALIRELGSEQLCRRQRAAEADIRSLGVSFTVYDEKSNIDREWPFDIIPRVLPAAEWARLEQGLMQRLTALNLFIDDLYGRQQVLKDGVFPAELLASSKNFRPQCVGARPRFGVWAHISGTDLVRDADGTVYVLEDNLRVPSGVSYMLENRNVTKRVFPELFQDQRIQPVDGYVARLFDLLVSLAPPAVLEPTVVVLTPGVYNSAYFEHCFLAQQMGVELVEGRDLVTLSDDCVYVKTIDGLERVHVVYRRVDDLALDPEAFDASSLLGSRGLFRAWRAGNVAIVNAPGAGVADDKVVYSYVPKLIRYYLQQDAIIPNVPTYRMCEPAALKEVLREPRRFVVKPANESGGYGVVIGSQASDAELEACRRRIIADPRNYVAQPIVSLSVAPTLCDGQIEPRHLDLRPFILSGASQYVTRGGLTRVALRKGSLVVNSSQGGGSKDTWVVEA